MGPNLSELTNQGIVNECEYIPIERRHRIIIMKSTAISAAAARKRKSRANQTTKKTVNVKKDANQRMIALRLKRKHQNDLLYLRRFLAPYMLDVIAIRVTDLEHNIISLKEKADWKALWEDPEFESTLSKAVCNALAALNRGNLTHGCELKDEKDDSSLILGNDLPNLRGHFLPHKNQMKDDIASFKCICPKMYLNKFELKVAEFEISLHHSLIRLGKHSPVARLARETSSSSSSAAAPAVEVRNLSRINNGISTNTTASSSQQLAYHHNTTSTAGGNDEVWKPPVSSIIFPAKVISLGEDDGDDYDTHTVAAIAPAVAAGYASVPYQREEECDDNDMYSQATLPNPERTSDGKCEQESGGDLPRCQMELHFAQGENKRLVDEINRKTDEIERKADQIKQLKSAVQALAASLID